MWKIQLSLWRERMRRESFKNKISLRVSKIEDILSRICN
jgi:hypothetical protein